MDNKSLASNNPVSERTEQQTVPPQQGSQHESRSDQEFYVLQQPPQQQQNGAQQLPPEQNHSQQQQQQQQQQQEEEEEQHSQQQPPLGDQQYQQLQQLLQIFPQLSQQPQHLTDPTAWEFLKEPLEQLNKLRELNQETEVNSSQASTNVSAENANALPIPSLSQDVTLSYVANLLSQLPQQATMLLESLASGTSGGSAPVVPGSCSTTPVSEGGTEDKVKQEPLQQLPLIEGSLFLDQKGMPFAIDLQLQLAFYATLKTTNIPQKKIVKALEILQQSGIKTIDQWTKLSVRQLKDMGIQKNIWQGADKQLKFSRPNPDEMKRKRTASQISTPSLSEPIDKETERRVAIFQYKINDYLKSLHMVPNTVFAISSLDVFCIVCESSFKLNKPCCMLSLKRHIEGRNRHPGSLSRHLINASKHSAFKKEMFFLPGYQPPSVFTENVTTSQSTASMSSATSSLPISVPPTAPTLAEPFNAMPTTAGSPLPVPPLLSSLVAQGLNPATDTTPTSLNTSIPSATPTVVSSSNELATSSMFLAQGTDEQQAVVWKTEDEQPKRKKPKLSTSELMKAVSNREDDTELRRQREELDQRTGRVHCLCLVEAYAGRSKKGEPYYCCRSLKCSFFKMEPLVEAPFDFVAGTTLQQQMGSEQGGVVSGANTSPQEPHLVVQSLVTTASADQITEQLVLPVLPDILVQAAQQAAAAQQQQQQQQSSETSQSQ